MVVEIKQGLRTMGLQRDGQGKVLGRGPWVTFLLINGMHGTLIIFIIWNYASI